MLRRASGTPSVHKEQANLVTRTKFAPWSLAHTQKYEKLLRPIHVLKFTMQCQPLWLYGVNYMGHDNCETTNLVKTVVAYFNTPFGQPSGRTNENQKRKYIRTNDLH
jgi:hypothetical protein